SNYNSLGLFSDNIIRFYKTIQPPSKLPKGIDVLYPQQEKEVIKIVEQFYKKFYSDNNKRTLIFGINPGRFGAGVTGINFTASRQLKENCDIDHSFKMQSELSAEFIYEMIEWYGGVKKFYQDFFISAISPLGYVKNGINLNYYDDKKLLQSVTPFIVNCINEQFKWNVNTQICFCIGGEKNYKFFDSLNKTHRWFGKIVPLPHPRFIMQYRRKIKGIYLLQYLTAFSEK
ncbi:MAG: uracil-DNA glycosylase family protein, partial [Bacteroidota bacterium]